MPELPSKLSEFFNKREIFKIAQFRRAIIAGFYRECEIPRADIPMCTTCELFNLCVFKVKAVK